MTTFIEDSPRPFQAKWIIEAVTEGVSSSAVLTPFASPWHHRGGPGKKPGMRQRSEELTDAGVEIWFDPTTHALQMGGVGDFRYYDEFDLWSGPRGDLSTSAFREQHVRKVFDIQGALGSKHLAPTVLLHTGLSPAGVVALELAQATVSVDANAWLSIAGTPEFWASGSALDAHVGSLAALDPAGWFLTVVRPLNTLPPLATAEEVFGLCRTSRALGEDAHVHVSHGDLVGLPAIAAGASSVGTGWDKRQRVCAYSDYVPRDGGASGGAWFERPTFMGLFGSLTSNEASVLDTRDPVRSARLGGIPAPGPKEAFMNHLRAIHSSAVCITALTSFEERSRALANLYETAIAEWTDVRAIAHPSTSDEEWIRPMQSGLNLYMASEGW